MHELMTSILYISDIEIYLDKNLDIPTFVITTQTQTIKIFIRRKET